METGAEHIFDAPIDEVWAMFSDPQSHIRKFSRMGHRDIEVLESDVHDDRFHLVVRRVVDVDLPGYARKVIQPTNTVTTTDSWTRRPDGSCHGEQQVSTQGAPVRIASTTELMAEDGRTRYVIRVELDVKVPLIGGRLSGWARGMVDEQLRQEFDAGDAWLSGDRGDPES